ncbi:DUF308 domain-containing protein [Candidatus Saccharibacteria bacterium]|nr:DUF308 domain-containing protein [Candidatus Saccharibacteria bacterium]
MAHINRRYIDKHWLSFVLRGGVAIIFGFLALFGALSDFNFVISMLIIYLLIMGIIDATGALYNSMKKRGWVNSVVDALIDVAAALCLLFLGMNNYANSMIILALYTGVSGVVDIFHAFVSTVDPTDRFIRLISGVIGAITGFVILNAGGFTDKMIFARFFGGYLLVVGVTSMIYGIHNRSQKIEDIVARSEARKKVAKKAAKKSVAKAKSSTKTAAKKKAKN